MPQALRYLSLVPNIPFLSIASGLANPSSGSITRANHWHNLSQIAHRLQNPLLIFFTIWNDDLSAHLGYKIWPIGNLHIIRKYWADLPSLDTRYRPRNPVHPKTVTTCPVTALYPGGPRETIVLFEPTLARSCSACYASGIEFCAMAVFRKLDTFPGLAARRCKRSIFEVVESMPQPGYF